MEQLTQAAIREKIGQMVMCGFAGKTPTEGILRLIREYSLGGVIYFRDNIGTTEEVRTLSDALQSAARDAGTDPLWIAVDQEGGMVARIDREVALMPGNMALGAAGSPELVYETARISGVELRSLGITLNFAPCVDVNNNKDNPVIGVRSYGENPEWVGVMGAQAVRGFQEGGVSACAKHFPGHGDTVADSHLELPSVPHGLERLRQVELPPFQRAIAAGVDVIMTAHVQFPAYDASGLPATLSPAVLEGLLRKELAYDGVIATDCLEMNAISKTVGVGRGAVLAVKAGADLVLVSHRLELQLEALEALYEAVLSGEIPQERIVESAARIRLAKEHREQGWQRLVSAGVPPVGARQHLEAAERAAERGVTLVKAEGGALPLRHGEPTLVIWPRTEAKTDVDESIRQEMTLGKALAPYLTDVLELSIGLRPSDPEMEAALAAASAGRLQIVVGTYNASFNPGQVKLVQELLQLPGAKVTVAALRSPYDLLVLPAQVHAYAACYENRPLMLEAAARVLAGLRPAAGRLPVTLSPEYPAGWGLAGSGAGGGA